MRQLNLCVLVAAAATFGAAPSSARGPEGVCAVSARLAEEVAVEGVLKSADPKGGSLVLSNGSKSVSLRIDPATTYVRNGKVVPMTEVLVVGSRIRVVHTDALARRIEPVAETPPAKSPGRPARPAKP